MSRIVLDGTKIGLYQDRIEAWKKGERIVPITIDMALTTSCNMRCEYCYGQLQKNKNYKITKEHMKRFLDDCAEMGVKGVSLVSDGESSISDAFEYSIYYGNSLGIAMASGTNGYVLQDRLQNSILPCLTYLRINISAGERIRYNEIMGARGDMFDTVVSNITKMVDSKRAGKHRCTIGMQMVFLPKYVDQVIPLSKLALDLGVDYLIIKHCSDDEFGNLGVDYGKYEETYAVLKKAESLSTNRTCIRVKWSKIRECGEKGAVRDYSTCLAPPFILQISGTGLVAPCGMLFHERYSDYHMGNITETGFHEIWRSERYWSVIRKLQVEFDARTMCGSLCLQHSANKYLHGLEDGGVNMDVGDVLHKEFI